ncbi:uncharacterized protein MONBRDRAFT_28444 [Monosiga brevicollis MX1]|uniref:Uncharacterized protein n=1 Tax=Monosiga brevicollis TaxID=81824 RepID=A9V868_MONBE|nr:uncharacterized protein MONBRDRAFT_28444 [Monosiga brevicollis MX1]EDQ86285.1 predicted protein [Monosiga brevicollis MX1]|eukprot:XP_001748955.1 hypothetical protein [Monosiga brevicollis MX1]
MGLSQDPKQAPAATQMAAQRLEVEPTPADSAHVSVQSQRPPPRVKANFQMVKPNLVAATQESGLQLAQAGKAEGDNDVAEVEAKGDNDVARVKAKGDNYVAKVKAKGDNDVAQAEDEVAKAQAKVFLAKSNSTAANQEHDLEPLQTALDLAKAKLKKARVKAEGDNDVAEVKAEGDNDVAEVKAEGDVNVAQAEREVAKAQAKVFLAKSNSTAANQEHDLEPLQTALDVAKAKLKKARVKAEGDNDVAEVKAEGDNYVAKVKAKGDNYVAKVKAKGDVNVAQAEREVARAQAKVSLAKSNSSAANQEHDLEPLQTALDVAKAKLKKARVKAEGDNDVAEVKAEGDNYVAKVKAKGDNYVAKVKAKGDVNVAQAEREVARAQAKVSLAKSNSTAANQEHDLEPLQTALDLAKAKLEKARVKAEGDNDVAEVKAEGEREVARAQAKVSLARSNPAAATQEHDLEPLQTALDLAKAKLEKARLKASMDQAKVQLDWAQKMADIEKSEQAKAVVATFSKHFDEVVAAFERSNTSSPLMRSKHPSAPEIPISRRSSSQPIVGDGYSASVASLRKDQYLTNGTSLAQGRALSKSTIALTQLFPMSTCDSEAVLQETWKNFFDTHATEFPCQMFSSANVVSLLDLKPDFVMAAREPFCNNNVVCVLELKNTSSFRNRDLGQLLGYLRTMLKVSGWCRTFCFGALLGQQSFMIVKAILEKAEDVRYEIVGNSDLRSSRDLAVLLTMSPKELGWIDRKAVVRVNNEEMMYFPDKFLGKGSNCTAFTGKNAIRSSYYMMLGLSMCLPCKLSQNLRTSPVASLRL